MLLDVNTRISIHPYTLRFKKPAETSRGALYSKEVIFLRIWHIDNPEVVGWGECGPIRGLSTDDSNNFVRKIIQHRDKINGGGGIERRELSHLPSFVFGIEMAQHDLMNGGRQHLFTTDFSLGTKSLSTHGLIWMDSPEGIARQVASKLALGFDVIKMKIGALPFEVECNLLEQIRRIAPSDRIALRLDANGAFTAEDVLDRLEQLAQFDVHFVEQPIQAGQWSEMARICRQSPIPIGLDEELIGIHSSDKQEALLSTIQPQHLIIKPTLLGGFAASERWMTQAEEIGCTWWINSLLESNIGLNAICQWTSYLDTERVHGLGTGQLFRNNIPAPIRLDGAQLVYRPEEAWNFASIYSTLN